MKEIQTRRYSIQFEELAKGGPAGYESVYLTSEGDPASEELYQILGHMQRKLLPIENKSIRQRNGSALVEALKSGKTIGIASGFKPSGAYHFGHKLTSSAVSFFQKEGIQIFMPVADVECEMDVKLSKETYEYWAADNLIDWGANGVNLDATHVYLQSEEKRVNDIAYVVARNLSFDLAVDTYGMEKLIEQFPFLFAGITQVADIILPQHPDFGNYHSFMVSGQDQDGHMKMTVGLVEKALQSNIRIPGLQTVPSGFYIPHIRGLTGEKASSSRVKGTLYLGSGPNKLGLDERVETIHKNIDSALADPGLREHVKKCVLDMVRYIDFFNDLSRVNFGELMADMPKSLVQKLANETDEKARTQLLDNYLIDECEKIGQDNVVLVRDSTKDAVVDHQRKRQRVFNYAVERANAPVQTAWDSDYVAPKAPDFWEVPEKAIVDSAKRNRTMWFDIINNVRDKVVP